MMKVLRCLSSASALLVLVGCAAPAHHAPIVTITAPVCRGIDWSLSGLRDDRESFIGTKTTCIADRLKLAAQILAFSDNKAEIAHARNLVDSALNGNGSKSPPDAALVGLATLLDRQLNERRRADERTDKLTAQIREQQSRIDDLNAKIAALTALEQSMAQKSARKRIEQ